MSRDLLSGQAFDVLDKLSPLEGVMQTRGSGVSTGWGEILFALDSQSRRHVLIPVEPKEVVSEDKRSAGVQLLSAGTLEDGLAYADVVCLLPHLEAIFEVLADEMLDALVASQEPVAVVHSSLTRWREMFERPVDPLLGVTVLGGVVGELVVLRLLASHGHSVSADWWTGPQGHVHDIVAPKHSLEVKTTLRRDDSSVIVNGLGQFADLPTRSLHVVLVRLLHNPAGDLTLPLLIDHLTESGLERAELMRRAGEAGVDSRDYAAYDKVRFELLTITAFPVDSPGFPRLTEKHVAGPVPPGVSKIRYTADLNVAIHSALDHQELDLLLRNMANS